MRNTNRQILRDLAANAFWMSRKIGQSDWTRGYWYGIFQAYLFAAQLLINHYDNT